MTLCAVDDDGRACLAALEGFNLPELLIVSKVTVADTLPEGKPGAAVPGVAVAASEAPGTKCPRCWQHSEQADENGLCPRCARVVSFLKQ